MRLRLQARGDVIEQSFAVADGPPAFELSHTSVAVRKRRRVVHGMDQDESVPEGGGELGSNAHRRSRAGRSVDAGHNGFLHLSHGLSMALKRGGPNRLRDAVRAGLGPI